MSSVRKFIPENKLAKTLEDRNGLLMTQAIQRAASNIEAVRDEHLAALDGKLDQLCLVAAAATESHSANDAAQVYRLAREVLADAGIFGLKHMNRVAHSLCELMAAGDRHRHQWTGITVHVEAIQALRRMGRMAAGPGVDAMIAGLEKISRMPV
ncbi:MAG TPA: hypothetical protein VG942_02675 [Hyphomonadaceae bacterium]|nr:hypothetical protein [Hyphomonadaceae bacterium]